QRNAASASDSGAGFTGAGVAESGQVLGREPATGVDDLHPVFELAPSPPAQAATEAPAPPLDSAGSATAKPRRSRVRARKGARAALEAVPEALPVTWIRVGPGKYVRADAAIPSPAQVPDEEVSPSGHPATDGPTPAPPTSEDVVAGAELASDA